MMLVHRVILHPLLAAAFLFLSTGAFGQTCQGAFIAKIIDESSGKTLGRAELKPKITFLKVVGDQKYHWDKEPTMPVGSAMRSPRYRVERKDSNSVFTSLEPYLDRSRFRTRSDYTDLVIPLDCGFYLVRMEMSHRGETMALNIYNLAPNVSFDLAPLPFISGEYSIDLQNLEAVQFLMPSPRFRHPVFEVPGEHLQPAQLE